MADLNVTRFIIDGKTFVIPLAAANQNGLMSASDYSKLAGIEEGGTSKCIEWCQGQWCGAGYCK